MSGEERRGKIIQALKLAGILIPVQLSTEYMFLTESRGAVWARV